VAGGHGWPGTLLSDGAGIYDRQGCGGQVEERCRLKDVL